MAGKKREKCKNCGKYFIVKRPWQRFCKDSCRNDWHCERVREAKKLLEERERSG